MADKRYCKQCKKELLEDEKILCKSCRDKDLEGTKKVGAVIVIAIGSLLSIKKKGNKI